MVGGYTLFILNEYSMWIAMLVYAYSRGGAPRSPVWWRWYSWCRGQCWLLCSLLWPIAILL